MIQSLIFFLINVKTKLLPLLLIVALGACVSTPKVDIERPIVISVPAFLTSQLDDKRSNRPRSTRSASMGNETALWVGDDQFVPNLPEMIAAFVLDAMRIHSVNRVILLDAYVGVHRIANVEPRMGGAPPFLLIPGAALGAVVVGNYLGARISDYPRIAKADANAVEYWVADFTVLVNDEKIHVTNRRRREPNDVVSAVLPELVKFSADDVALKYRLVTSK